jgi:hypothetical protein
MLDAAAPPGRLCDQPQARLDSDAQLAGDAIRASGH